MKHPQRTIKQNSTIHAIFSEVSDAMEMMGSEIKLNLAPTPTVMKEFFIHHYLNDKRTSQCNTKELAEAFDRFLRNMNTWLRDKGLEEIEIKNEDAKSSLATYS